LYPPPNPEWEETIVAGPIGNATTSYVLLHSETIERPTLVSAVYETFSEGSASSIVKIWQGSNVAWWPRVYAQNYLLQSFTGIWQPGELLKLEFRSDLSAINVWVRNLRILKGAIEPG